MLETIVAHIYKQHKMMVKNSAELAWIFVYPFVALLSIGLFAYYISLSGGPPEAVLFVLVGVIVWNFYDLTQRAVTYGMTYDMWSNSLRHGMVNASGTKEFIIGNSFYGLLTSYLVVIFVGIAGIMAFGFNVFSAGPVLIISLLPVFLFATSIGLLINSLMITRGHNWMSLIWSISGVIMIFSGVFYPLDILPEAVRFIALSLPTTYSIDALRAVFGFTAAPIFESIFIAFLISVVYLVICIFIFTKAVKRSKTTGKLTQY